MSIPEMISFDEMCQRGSIRDTDVQQLRALFYKDAHVSRKEAEALFELNDACRVQDASWPVFFVEAITAYIVNDIEPKGYLTAANADWLIERVSTDDGIVSTQAEMELLLAVMERARWVPERLARFALEQVERAIVSREGPLRTVTGLSVGEVTVAGVALLRKVLYAFGGDGNVAVTRNEAEVLFRINDATKDADNTPEWQELFVKAIAGVVMAASGYEVPPRHEALRRERWLQERGDLSVGAFLAAIAKGGLTGIREAYIELTPEERAIARLEQQRIEIITNEEVTGGEVSWLAEQIGRDGELSPNEIALLAYLKAESPRLHPLIAPLLDRLDEAA